VNINDFLEIYQQVMHNPEAFDIYMKSVDKRLKAAGIDIPGRTFAALSEISREFNCIISFDDELAKRVNKWFQDRYGDRLKLSWQIGKMVVLIDGDPYIVRYPLVPVPRTVNPLEWIVDATPTLLHAISPNDLDILVESLISGYESFQQLEELPDAAIANLETAIVQIMNRPPHYGESKWASLQATEKTLKAYIKQQGGAPKYTHKLTNLAKEAENFGLPPVSQPLIDCIQCPADVRHGDISVTLDEAIKAHHASIQVCMHIATNFSR
jgi:hypothetical protein